MVILIVLIALFAACETQSADLQEVRDCVAGNRPERSIAQTIAMRAYDRTGEPIHSRARVYWIEIDDGEQRGLIRILEPKTRRGSAVLTVRRAKDEPAAMWLYLPAIRRVRRITSGFVQGSMFGTDLSYEDFERLQQAAQRRGATILGTDVVGGRAVHVIESRPTAQEASAYERVVSLIDQERCLPLRTEFFGPGDTLSKVMTAETITQEEFGWIARRIEVDNVLEGTRTELEVEKLEPHARITESQMSISGLERNDY